jgi:PAS domain S-box-containing protein
MLESLTNFFASGSFIPHGHCYLWKPYLVGLHVAADGLIAIAYYSIPITLFYFVRHRRDLPFDWIFLLFASFIVACGTTHLLEIWTLWHPTYWLSGAVKAGTAFVSLYTAGALVPLVPKALSLPSPTQIEVANRELQREIAERRQVEAALRESEEKFRQLAENIRDVFWISVPSQSQLIYVSPAYEEIWGRKVEELNQDLATWLTSIHPDDRPRVEKAFSEKVFQGLYNEEYRIQRSDGAIRWIRGRGFPIIEPSGEIHRVAGIAEDITDRKQVEDSLRESEARYRAIVEDQTEMICRFRADGIFTFVNAAYCRYFGRTPEELIGHSYAPTVFPDDLKYVENQLNSLNPENPVVTVTNRVIHPSGEIRTHQWTNRMIFNEQSKFLEFQAVGRDITELQQTREIQMALKEKVVLLKEIHHRVKNNLQIIYSLLRLQSRQIQNQQVAQILLESQNRVKSIALIHEKLYRSEDLSQISLNQYIPSLAANLFSSYKISSDSIALETQVADISLDIDTAIPCGLIINELISNSLKYAFPGGREGKIWLKLQAAQDGFISLIVGDNGIGIPEEVDPNRVKSLGLSLVRDLATQLKGTMVIERQEGTLFMIRFPGAAHDSWCNTTESPIENASNSGR